MSKVSILIVEDEPLIADDIANLLKKNDCHVTAIVDNAQDAFLAIEKYTPDVSILDINIEGDMDGIALAAKLDMPFIFLTSYYDKATLSKAGLVNPSGYIIKPFSESDIIANIELALNRRQVKNPIKERMDKFFVRHEQEILSINTVDILYAEAFDNYSIVYLENEKHIVSHTLKSVEEKLAPQGFIRVHRSYLINFEMIDSISEGFVYLKGHRVLIGKSYRKNFINMLTML